MHRLIPFLLLLANPALAGESLPEGLRGVEVQEHLGTTVDRSLRFTDHTGAERTLGELMGGDKPVLLTLNYYRCKMLCNLQLNALVRGLKGVGYTPGDEYRILTISFDHREGWELGRDKRASYLESLGMGDVDWTFAVGDEASIRTLTEQIGYSLKYDPILDQFAHTAAIFFLSPSGVLTRYLYGLQYISRDIRFAVVDAAEGKVGSTVDKIILSCFLYDSSVGAYAPFAFGVMRLGGLAIVTCLSAFLGLMWRIEQRRALSEAVS